jgi:hypothetical protein
VVAPLNIPPFLRLDRFLESVISPKVEVTFADLQQLNDAIVVLVGDLIAGQEKHNLIHLLWCPLWRESFKSIVNCRSKGRKEGPL